MKFKGRKGMISLWSLTVMSRGVEYLYEVNLFYTTRVDPEHYFLEGQEARHCAQVLRHREGDEVVATDGKGQAMKGIIASIQKDEVKVEIRERTFIEPDQRQVHLVFGILKNASRMEWLIEKVTEIGASSLQPVICQRTQRSKLNMVRLQKVMVSAAKQSLKYLFPILHEPIKLDDYLVSHQGQGYIAHYSEANQNLWEHKSPTGSCVVLIGPEGDFSDEEVALADTAGFQKVNLGSYRLRAETAAMVAISSILNNVRNE